MADSASIRFSVVPGTFGVYRLDGEAPIPNWASGSAFLSITRTRDELSIVCAEHAASASIRSERGWALLQLQGPFSFDTVGILAAFSAPLAEAAISILAIGTFDTDYVLVKKANLDDALRALEGAGHELVR
jgi:uncharacterized protein